MIGINPTVASHKMNIIPMDKLVSQCDPLIPRVPLTTRQPAEYSWMSSNPTPHLHVPFSGTHDLPKIRQSLLCMGSST